MLLPDSFIQSLEPKFSDGDLLALLTALDQQAPTSIRTNPNKPSTPVEGKNVQWCPLGTYLKERPVFTLDPSFHAGAYYVQEASSMFIWHILEQIAGQNKDIRILDLSAAPGGKSTLIAAFLNHKGLLVANEIVKNRAYTLKYNLSKEGYSNVVVTNNDPKDFTVLEDYFDIILVDAPCSGEGMFRKDPNAITEWSPQNVTSCAIRQQKILTDILPSLKEGGHLIYSTCTYNDDENINNVKYGIEEFDMSSVKINTENTWGITEIQKENAIGYQFYPHKTNGEGFFAAVLQKTSPNNTIKWRVDDKNIVDLDKKQIPIVASWVNLAQKELLVDKVGNIHLFPSEYKEDARILSHYLRLIYCGTTLGTLNKTVFIPDHSLALSLDRSVDIPIVELNKMDALRYLKRELNDIDSPHKSWVLATYEGLGIGWLKNLGNRINNYLPAEYRILMKIE